MARLQVTVCAARRLKGNSFIGVPDPYAKVCVGSVHLKTRIIKDTLNPEWNETLTLQIPDTNADLVVEVWYDGTLSDGVMGTCKLPLSTLEHGIVMDRWFVLINSKTNAELHIRVLAVDFGCPPTSSNQWMVTTDINSDPQLSQSQCGASGGVYSNPPTGVSVPYQPSPPQPAMYAGYALPQVPPPMYTTTGGYLPNTAPPPQMAYGAPPMVGQYQTYSNSTNTSGSDLPVPIGGVGPMQPSAPPNPYQQSGPANPQYY